MLHLFSYLIHNFDVHIEYIFSHVDASLCAYVPICAYACLWYKALLWHFLRRLRRTSLIFDAQHCISIIPVQNMRKIIVDRRT